MAGPAAPQTTFSQARVMIVEDDRTMEPLWRYIVDSAEPGANVEWVTSGEAARRLISERFDLIIADIFLGGQTTGLDLWDSLDADSQSAFILMSVLSPQRLSILASTSRRSGSERLPPYLQKPLDPHQCIETVRALIASNRRSV